MLQKHIKGGGNSQVDFPELEFAKNTAGYSVNLVKREASIRRCFMLQGEGRWVIVKRWI
jgi:hypothetical protein